MSREATARAAEALSWAPHAEVAPRTVARLPRYPAVEECAETTPEGPCQHRECRYHLAHRGYWEHEARPNRDCSLDFANEGPHTPAEVADALGVSSERVRQLELHALESLRREPTLRQFHDGPENGKVRRPRRKRGEP